MIEVVFDTNKRGVSVKCGMQGKNRIDSETNLCTEACAIVNALYESFKDHGYDLCAYAFKQMCLDGNVFKDFDEIKADEIKADAEPLAEPKSNVNPLINELLKSIFGENV